MTEGRETMTTIYVLILFIGQYQKGGLATHEFNSREACEVAGKAFAVAAKEQAGGYVAWTCTPKG